MVLTVTSGAIPIIVAVGHVYFLVLQREKKEVPFSMATGNELMHECFLKRSRIGTARMKYDKKTDEEGKKRRR